MVVTKQTVSKSIDPVNQISTIVWDLKGSHASNERNSLESSEVFQSPAVGALNKVKWRYGTNTGASKNSKHASKPSFTCEFSYHLTMTRKELKIYRKFFNYSFAGYHETGDICEKKLDFKLVLEPIVLTEDSTLPEATFANISKHERNTCCDVQFKVEGELIGAHKTVLSDKNPAFQQLFKDNRKNKKAIEIPGTSFESFSIFINLFYGFIEENLDVSTWIELLFLANKYESYAIKQFVALKLIRSVEKIRNSK